MKFDLINNSGYWFTFELVGVRASSNINAEIRVFSTKGIEGACSILRGMFENIMNSGGINDIEIDVEGWDE